MVTLYSQKVFTAEVLIMKFRNFYNQWGHFKENKYRRVTGTYLCFRDVSMAAEW